jgi:diguanylate cyclase (GGDEF)-like protein
MRKSKENARIAREADMKVISSGRGSNYVIKEEDDEGVDYLQIIKEPVKNEKGEVTGIIAIVNNVTDSELLKQELRKKSITDPLTELYNRYYYEELEAEYKNKMTIPITVISADCDGLKRINDKYGHAAGDKYICFARDAIQESLPEKSYLFRMGGDEFVAVIPGMKSYDAAILTKEIVKNSKKYKNSCNIDGKQHRNFSFLFR